MRLFRSTAERLLMIRSRVIVFFFFGDVQIEKHLLVFQCHNRRPITARSRGSNCTTCSLSFGLTGGTFASRQRSLLSRIGSTTP